MNTVLIKWSKTLLYSYPHITKFVKALEEELNSVTSLGYGSKHFSYGQSTYDFLESMLTLGKRIRNLKEIEETIGEILDEIGNSGEILGERYVKHRCIEEIIPNVSPRTMYRRFDNAIGDFSFELLRRGYTPSVLEEMFGKERFILAIKNRLKCGSRPIYAHREGNCETKEKLSEIKSDVQRCDNDSCKKDTLSKTEDEVVNPDKCKGESIKEKDTSKINRVGVEYILPVDISVMLKKYVVV